ncbi:MotA/TolQ/ExbB proton channel family protein [Fodinibius sp. Rm-B-1B1-1]|uniref:MotA/TolQ/ExbB proton channel family protein n=1 Tax=Fodinibius alkaliphilus TaxID=3140241 RepID=UPI003159BC39
MTSSIALFFLQAGVDQGFFNVLVEKFNEGNEGGFMWPVLVALILGLAIFLERIITLNLADIDTRKFIVDVQEALQEGGVPAAKELCAETRGPVASVFQAGLMRVDEGIEAAEKAISSYGSIEMSFLERGLVWLSLFIAIAPMLGFLGTVVGMIQAFDAIEQAGDISPTLVAGGIKVALLTTAAGLLAGIILQVGYNYCVSKIDRLISEMEESSITLIDSIVMLKEGEQIVDTSGSDSAE